MRPYTEVRFSGSPEEVRERWLKERRRGVGGSDAAAVLGLSPYATPLTVWLEKTGQVIPEDISDKPAVYWGTALEPIIAEEFVRHHQTWRVRRKNALLRSREHPFMQASLDREVTDERGRKGVLEIKTCGAHRKGDWDDGIPDYYMPQPIHYLAVTGYEFYAVAVLIGGQEYREYIYERDQEDVEFVIRREREFWDMVEGNIMPAPGNTQADSKALAEIYQAPGEEYVELTDSAIPEIAELLKVNDELAKMETRKRELANTIKARIGDAKGIRTPSCKATWVRTETTSFDSRALKEMEPETYQRYIRTKARDGGLRVSKED